MEVLKKECVSKLAEEQDPFYQQIASGLRLLVIQLEARKSVKKGITCWTLHLATTGTNKVDRMQQVWSQIMTTAMESK